MQHAPVTGGDVQFWQVVVFAPCQVPPWFWQLA
jgi:hypothetical protein